MINKFNDHFILIDKCAEQTRIVEILNHKIDKFIAWFDTTPPLIGSVYDAVIVKKLNGGVVRAKIKDKWILSVRGVPKSLDVNNKIKIIITSEEFEDKPVQARILFANSTNYENLDDVQRIMDLFFTKNIPIIEDMYAIYWDILELDKELIGALQPKIELSEGGRIWIEKTRAATLIDIDTHKLLLNSEEEILQFCIKAFVRWKKQESKPIPNFTLPNSQGPQDTHGRDKGLNPYENPPIKDWSIKTTGKGMKGKINCDSPVWKKRKVCQ